MEDDTHYLCIRLEMRSDAVLDEPMLRQTLLQTFESLGGLSRAIVHYDVLAINESSLPGVNQQDREAWICLDRSDSKFVKAALPTFASSPDSPIIGMGLLSETSSLPPGISS